MLSESSEDVLYLELFGDAVINKTSCYTMNAFWNQYSNWRFLCSLLASALAVSCKIF